MKLKYDGGNAPCIFYMEVEYDINGTSFVAAHGDSNRGSNTVQVTKFSTKLPRVKLN